MTISRFSETPEQILARAFAKHVLAWAHAIHSSSDTNINQITSGILENAAYHVSLAVSSGNACFPLEELINEQNGQTLATLRMNLFSSGVVSPANDPSNAPLVLDDDNRLYLNRYFSYERSLAQQLANLCKAPQNIDISSCRALLETLFPHENNETINWQKIAVALILRQSLLIVSGGPGTGKTTTVASLLTCLLALNPHARIMLAAPTGKAAMRMQDAISQCASRFPPQIQLPKQAQTIHRLLGLSGDGVTTRYHAKNPLPLDALIIDEASMLDLAMATHLFNAIPTHAKVILLGDKDQLAAVEAGSVFAELSLQRVFTKECLADLEAIIGLPPSQKKHLSSLSGHTPLENNVIWLTHNYRFSETSGIGKLATDIRHHRTDDVIDFLCSGRETSVQWLDMANQTMATGFINILLNGYASYFDCVKNNKNNADRVFKTFNQFRILCAVREGPYGVGAINQWIASAMKERLSKTTGQMDITNSEWFTGKPIMIRKNNYSLGLFNGDVGITLPDASGHLSVWFMKEDGTFKTVPISRLGEHELSFAITVHQSQGSEFDAVALLLPSRFSRVLCRELVYTGITRAKTAITIMAEKAILKQSLENDSIRRSGLRERLRETWKTS